MKAMTYEEMLEVEGGRLEHYIDAGCATIGVASLFAGIAPVAAFCAGWGLGRALDSLI